GRLRAGLPGPGAAALWPPHLPGRTRGARAGRPAREGVAPRYGGLRRSRMRVALALVRASWLTQASYRVGVVLSFLALVATVVPVYFVADALQPVVASSIRDEGERYFGFLVVGLASLYLVGASVSALPQSISSG